MITGAEATGVFTRINSSFKFLTAESIQAAITDTSAVHFSSAGTRLLANLLGDPAQHGATLQSMSRYLQVFGPSALCVVLDKFRGIAQGYRSDVGKFDVDDWSSLGKSLFGAIVETRERTETSQKRAGASLNRSHAPASSDFSEAENDVLGLGDSPLDLGDDASVSFSSFRPVPISALVTEVLTMPDLNFQSFVNSILRHGVCLQVLESPTHPDELSAEFMLPTYDVNSLQRLHVKPIHVEFQKMGTVTVVKCSCAASSMKSFPTAGSLPCLHEADCWHAGALRTESVRNHLVRNAAAKCNPITGIPDSDFICIVSAQRSIAAVSLLPVPARMHVYCYVTSGPGTPGNLRPATLTLTWLDGALQVTCDACSRMRKGGAIPSSCKHHEKLLYFSEHPENQQHVLVKQMLTHKPPAAQRPCAFDVATQRWSFPSLDRDLFQIRESLGFSVPRQCRRPVNSNPIGLGGIGDPAVKRLMILFDTLQIWKGDPAPALLAHKVIDVNCPICPQGMRVLSIDSRAGHLASASSCVLCGSSSGGSFCQCAHCALAFCVHCLEQLPVRASSSKVFNETFPEFSHLDHGTSGGLSYFARLVESALAMPSSPKICLKPPIPTQLRGGVSAEDDIDTAPFPCHFEESGYVAVREAIVFGMSYSQQATVYGLRCSSHGDHVLPFVGPDRSMYVHSTKVIIRVELFDFFWHLLRHIKGSGIASFVAYIQMQYERNQAGSFVSEPVFRDAFFGYMSLLDIDFNKPCPSCVVRKDRRTGVLYSSCPVIGYDAVSLRSKGGDVRAIDEVEEGAPEVDCENAHIYERLFIPGSRTKSETGRLRVKLAALCAAIRRSYRSKMGENFAELPAQLGAQPSLSHYAPAVVLMCESVASGSGSLMIERISAFFELMTNEQGEIFQIANVAEVRFLSEVVSLCEAGTGVDHFFLRRQLDVRKSLVDLVKYSLVQMQPAGPGAHILVTVHAAVLAMLQGLLEATEIEFAKVRKLRVLPPIPAAERKPANPAQTGIAINFTQGGRMLRKIPKFKRVPSDVGSKKRTGACRKPQQLFNRHGKYQSKTHGLFNMVCLTSLVSMGVIIMHSPEGRSLGINVLYSHVPHTSRVVVCDTSCQSASWAHTRYRRFFMKWKFLVDSFHHSKGKRGHKCGAVTSPSEFSIMAKRNDSFVEQLHATQRFLGMTMQSTSLPRAMFLVQLVNDDVYHSAADKACVPSSRRSWPDAASVDFDSDSEDEASSSDHADGAACDPDAAAAAADASSHAGERESDESDNGSDEVGDDSGDDDAGIDLDSSDELDDGEFEEM